MQTRHVQLRLGAVNVLRHALELLFESLLRLLGAHAVCVEGAAEALKVRTGQGRQLGGELRLVKLALRRGGSCGRGE